MKITVGMIVCNGDDFLKECLAAVYPLAHAIVIAEGATENMVKAHGWDSAASQDRTLDILWEFPDPENKLHICSSSTPYIGKDGQCQAYMRMVPPDTDYLFQVDADEIMLESDHPRLLDLLEREKPDQVNFPMLHFWKGFERVGVGGDGWGWDTLIPRVFRYRPGSFWKTHRPPTMVTEGRASCDGKVITASDITIRHYSYVTEKQVRDKMAYYRHAFNRDFTSWEKNVWERWTPETAPEIERQFSTHPSVPGGKTRPFFGEHPASMKERVTC